MINTESEQAGHCSNAKDCMQVHRTVEKLIFLFYFFTLNGSSLST